MAKRRVLTVTESEAPLSKADVKALESRLGFMLPHEYSRFLLAHNGGSPKQDLFHFKNETGPYTDSCIDHFFAVHNGENNSLEKSYLFCKAEGLLPANLIFIADDHGGNMICLSISGPDKNSVYFWDYEAFDEEDDQANLHLIADSFSEFLFGLEEAPEYVESEFDRLLRENDIEGLKAFIASGWDVNTVHSGRQDIPVETASIYAQVEFVRILLFHGAKIGRSLEIVERCLAASHLAGLRDYDGVMRVLESHVDSIR